VIGRARRWAAIWAGALAVVGIVILPGSPAAADPAKASSDCTILGTPGPDVLRGTEGDDYICGLAGDDTIKGLGGDDVLQGGGGDDTINGGPGDDVLGGGRGSDKLNAHDATTYQDKLRCGRGGDSAVADVADVVRGSCESVDQDDPATAMSLTPASVAENQPAGTAVGVLGVTDPDPGDSHTFTLVPGTGSAGNGSFTIVGSTLRTAAALDHESTPTLSVRVRATDTGGLSFEKEFTVTVTDVGENPPVAVDDAYTATEDTTLDRPVSGAGSPAANDTDADGDAVTVTAVSGASGGTASISSGQIHFAPTANLCGAGAGGFDYTVSDGTGATDLGHVVVDITCVADDPVAVDDSATVTEDDPATAVAVLANDTDVDGGPKSIASVTQPANGTVVITGGGTGLTYKPNADYCNDPGAAPDDTFTYTLAPGGDTATVSVVVTCVADKPIAV